MRLSLLILFFLFLIPTHACDCDEPKDNIDSFKSGYTAVEFVIELKILKEITSKGQAVFGPIYYKAEVIKVYKGSLAVSNIELQSFLTGGSLCSYIFEEGNSYLFYGRKTEDGYYISSTCDRTAKLEDKDFDLNILNH